MELTNTGVAIVWYAPANAYIVWGDGQSLTNLDTLTAQRNYILGTHPYHPYYRLEASLQQAAASLSPAQMVDVTVQVFDSSHVNQTLTSLQAIAGQVWLQPSLLQTLWSISLQLPASQLIPVANWSDVHNVEPWSAPTVQDEVQDHIVAGNVTTSGANIVPRPTDPTSNPTYIPYRLWLISKGFSTDPQAYPIVDVVDDGVDTGDINNVLHPDFYQFGNTPGLPNQLRIAYFNTTILGDPDLRGGQHGHGNINAGIVCAYDNTAGALDASGYNRGIGVSPFGRVGSTKIFAYCASAICGNEEERMNLSAVGGTHNGLVQLSFNSGADLTSDSWGSPFYPGPPTTTEDQSTAPYNSDCQAYDALTRNALLSTSPNTLHEMLHVFSAGNDPYANASRPAPANSAASPGAAKNVLTVGATENVRPGAIDGCGVSTAASADNVAFFSLRGPTDDGRTKPDLMAPGTHVQGLASQDSTYDGLTVCNKYYPSGQTHYTWCSGTSQSAPAVAGGASLLSEWFQGEYSHGLVFIPQYPSPALLKALLINSSRYLGGTYTAYNHDTLPSNNQGWGEMNLGMAFDGTPRVWVDQTIIFTHSGQRPYTLQGLLVYDVTKPVRATLVWSDPPGNDTTMDDTASVLVNDLNLTVQTPFQSLPWPRTPTYRGNLFGATAGQRQYSQESGLSGGWADHLNNVECVFLPAPVTGPITVTVAPLAIAAGTGGFSPGVPGHGGLASQDFALVIYNVVQPVTPAADVYIRDFLADAGGEPDTIAGNVWESPDIWNRLDGSVPATAPADSALPGLNQPPVFEHDNWINVYLHNRADNVANGVVKLYWANASTSPTWPTDWNWFGNVYASLQPHANRVVNHLWHPPGSRDYSVMAVWVSGQDPLHAALTSSTYNNTRNNNNIAWRSMHVAFPAQGSPTTYGFYAGNSDSSGTNTYSMVLTARSTTNSDTFLDYGQLFFDLGTNLFQRWWQNGGQGTGFQLVPNQTGGWMFQVTNAAGAYINGIPLNPGEAEFVSYTFVSLTNAVRTFIVDATQMLGTNTIGGVSYTINTGPTLDSVGDGIPDWWRQLYFGGSGTTTNSASCATCDPDGDGFNNLQEYLAGTDPTNAASYFKIDSVARIADGTAVQLQFYANSNRTYSVLYSGDVQAGTWGVLTNVPALEQGQEITVTDTNAIPTRFYRLAAPALPEY